MAKESTRMPELTANAEDYQQALLAIRDDKTHAGRWDVWVRMLECQYAVPDRTITATQMFKRARMKSLNEVNLRYGELGHALATHLGYEPPKRNPGGGRPRWWMTLSTGDTERAEGADFEFTMRPALAEALENMRWVRRPVEAQ